jgi:hypothetical protein
MSVGNDIWPAALRMIPWVITAEIGNQGRSAGSPHIRQK